MPSPAGGPSDFRPPPGSSRFDRCHQRARAARSGLTHCVIVSAFPASWIPILIAAVRARARRSTRTSITDPLLPPGSSRSTPRGCRPLRLLITRATTPAMHLATLSCSSSSVSARLVLPSSSRVFDIAVIGGSTLGPCLLRRLDARPTLVSGSVGIAPGAMVLTTLHGKDGATAKFLASFALMGSDLARLPSPRPPREPKPSITSSECRPLACSRLLPGWARRFG